MADESDAPVVEVTNIEAPPDETAAEVLGDAALAAAAVSGAAAATAADAKGEAVKADQKADAAGNLAAAAAAATAAILPRPDSARPSGRGKGAARA